MWRLSVLLALTVGLVRLGMGQGVESVVGQVFTPDGKPAAKAKVWLVVHRWETDHPTVESTAFTDAQGNFRLPYKAPLRVYYAAVVAHKPGFAIGVKNFDPRERKPLKVQLNWAAPLKGIVLTPDGEPLPGARVWVMRLQRFLSPPCFEKPKQAAESFWMEQTPEEVTPLWAKTDSMGRFVLESLPASIDIELVAEHPDFSPHSLQISGSLRIPPDIVLVVAPKSSLKGQLIADGKPIAGQVICRPREEWEIWEMKGRRLKTDEQGQFESVLKPGSWLVWAIAGEGQWQCEPQPVTVVPGGTTTLSIQLNRAIEVSGTTVDAQTKTPVPFAEIYADRLITPTKEWQEWWRPQVVKADEQGKFRLFLLPGKWELNAWASYKPDHWIGAYRELEVTKEVTVTLELSEQKEPTVQIQVVDEKGKPVPRAILTDDWNTRQADERGQVEFLFLSRPIVAATPDLKAFGEVKVKPNTKSVRVVVRKGVPVRGQVTDEKGKPVPKAQMVVSALRYEPQPIAHEWPVDWFTVTADERGRFQFYLPAGQKAILTAYAPGFFPTTMDPFSPDPQNPPTLSVRLKRPDFTYEGVVVDAQTDEPVFGAAVKFSVFGAAVKFLAFLPGGSVIGPQRQLAFTDQKGRFQFTNLLREHLTRGELMVSHPAYRTLRIYLPLDALTTPSRIELERYRPTFAPEVAVGKPAPPLSDVRWLDGEAPSLQGKKTYLLFATPFDPACEKVMERLKVQQAKAPDTTQVIVIFDASLPPDEVLRYAQEARLPFKIGIVPEGRLNGWDSETFQRYGVQSVPMLVIVDEQGVVQAVNPKGDSE